MRFSSRFYAVAVLVVLAACSQSSKVATTTITTKDSMSDGTTTTSTGTSTTISNDQGQVTVGASPDAAKLGAPVYPGATQSPGGVVVSTVNGSGAVASFKTTDAFDKVYDFYKSQLPPDAEKMKTSSGTQSMAMFSTKVSGSTDTVLVQIASSDTGTGIVITRASKH
jgi:hypothetical protein